MQTEPAPIVLFTYKRLDHLQQTVTALRKNELAHKSQLFIYSDAAKSPCDEPAVNKVRQYLKGINGFQSIEIIEQKSNQGVVKSIINGVTDIIKLYKRAIILEDDLVTSTYFLTYLNDGLNYYQNNKRVFAVCGHNLPPQTMVFPENYSQYFYFSYRADPWGWATWYDRWQQADWEMKGYRKFRFNLLQRHRFNNAGDDLVNLLHQHMLGKNKAWETRWIYTLFKNNGVAIIPKYSFVNNIGFDGSGENCAPTDAFSNDVSRPNKNYYFVEQPHIDQEVITAFKQHFHINVNGKIHIFLNYFFSDRTVNKFIKLVRTIKGKT